MHPNARPDAATRVPRRAALSKAAPHAVRGRMPGKRVRGAYDDSGQPFVPPEDWHEGESHGSDAYRVVVRPPGKGFRHVVTPAEVQERLAILPERFVSGLEVVQLSRMTRKKLTFPCYGMQWGAAIYLYPLEEELVEYFDVHPGPQQWNEARMYGGRWEELGRGAWKLVWSEPAIKDFYLNNILLHELGHFLDDRNSNYTDRERYAEWFALHYGYKRSQRRDRAAWTPDRVRRRHHVATR